MPCLDCYIPCVQYSQKQQVTVCNKYILSSFLPILGKPMSLSFLSYPPNNISASLSPLQYFTSESCPLSCNLAFLIVCFYEFTQVFSHPAGLSPVLLLENPLLFFSIQAVSKIVPSVAFFPWYFSFFFFFFQLSLTHIWSTFTSRYNDSSICTSTPNLIPRYGHTWSQPHPNTVCFSSKSSFPSRQQTPESFPLMFNPLYFTCGRYMNFTWWQTNAVIHLNSFITQTNSTAS